MLFRSGKKFGQPGFGAEFPYGFGFINDNEQRRPASAHYIHTDASLWLINEVGCNNTLDTFSFPNATRIHPTVYGGSIGPWAWNSSATFGAYYGFIL